MDHAMDCPELFSRDTRRRAREEDHEDGGPTEALTEVFLCFTNRAQGATELNQAISRQGTKAGSAEILAVSDRVEKIAVLIYLLGT